MCSPIRKVQIVGATKKGDTWINHTQRSMGDSEYSDCFRDYSIVWLVIVLACSTCYGCLTPSELLNAKLNAELKCPWRKIWRHACDTSHLTNLICFQCSFQVRFICVKHRTGLQNLERNVWEEFQLQTFGDRSFENQLRCAGNELHKFVVKREMRPRKSSSCSQ